MVEKTTTGGSEGRVPLVRLFDGDALMIDDDLNVEQSRTTEAITLLAPGSAIPRVLTGPEIRDLYFAKRLKIVRGQLDKLSPDEREAALRPIESFSQDQQTEMLKRYDYVRACDKFFARKRRSKKSRNEWCRRPEKGYQKVADVVDRYRRTVKGKPEHRNWSSIGSEEVTGYALRVWYMRWLKSGRRIGALAPLTHKQGKLETSRLDPAVVALIHDVVRQKWLTLEAPPVSIVHDLICREVEKLNQEGHLLEPPSEMAVRRWINANIDPFEQVFFRKGRKEATHRFRLTSTAPVATRPLQIVEFDETPLDIILVDQQGKEEKNQGKEKNKRKKKNKGKASEDVETRRAWLTAGTCVATGMVVGWHIGYEKPSWSTVMQALRMAVLKKDLGDSGAESPYPVFGVPEMIKVDNGAAYRSTSLIAAAAALQFELRFVPVGKPNLKGKVERFFREVARDFLSMFPGRTFSNVQMRGDYDSEGNAKFTLEEVRRLFMRWVVDIHHNRPNRRCFGETPLQRWNALAGCGVRLPPEADDLAPLIGMVINRTIQADGITFMGLQYRNEALKLMRQKSHMGRAWMVKIDPTDLMQIMVMDADRNRWVVVPCSQPHLVEGLTLKMWMDVVRSAKAATAAGQRVSRQTLLRAREFLMKAAAENGHEPRGKITEYDRKWIEDRIDSADFEISIDPNEPGAPNKVRGPRRRRTANAAAAVDADPSMTKPASEAGGHQIVDQQRPYAEIEEAEAEGKAAIREAEERRRKAEFVAQMQAKRVGVPKVDEKNERPSMEAPDEKRPTELASEAAPPTVPDAEPVVPKRRASGRSTAGQAARSRAPGLVSEHDPTLWNTGDDDEAGNGK